MSSQWHVFNENHNQNIHPILEKLAVSWYIPPINISVVFEHTFSYITFIYRSVNIYAGTERVQRSGCIWELQLIISYISVIFQNNTNTQGVDQIQNTELNRLRNLSHGGCHQRHDVTNPREAPASFFTKISPDGPFLNDAFCALHMTTRSTVQLVCYLAAQLHFNLWPVGFSLRPIFFNLMSRSFNLRRTRPFPDNLGR